MSAFDRPIIAIGMPRSGTTWIGKILDSHPLTLYRHEPDTWQRLDPIPLFPLPAPASSVDRAAVRDFVASLPMMRADRVCGKRPVYPKEYANRWAVNRYAALSFVQKALGRLGLEFDAPLPPQPRDGEFYRLAVKSIESLGRVGLLLDAVPEGRFVVIVRHPCGYVCSVLRGEAQKRFGHNEAAHDYALLEMACATEQGRRHGLTLEGLRAMTPPERLAWRWVIFNEKAADESKAAKNAYVLHYEKLCWDPGGEVRRLYEFCGLTWNRQTEEFVTQSTSQQRSDYYSVFKDPMGSAWGWQNQLDAVDVQRVMTVVRRSSVVEPYLSAESWNRPI
jgi:hypothetical protein